MLFHGVVLVTRCILPYNYRKSLRKVCKLILLCAPMESRYTLPIVEGMRFEIWNELDCLNSSEYHAIYAAAAKGLKRAAPTLQVGGQ